VSAARNAAGVLGHAVLGAALGVWLQVGLRALADAWA
jgi:hypothetical protein